MNTYDVINDRNLAQFYNACRTSTKATVEFALQKKFPINSTVKLTTTKFLGDTALHLAVEAFNSECYRNSQNNYSHIIEVLFAHGADVTITNAATRSPIRIAWDARPISNFVLLALFAGHGYNRSNVADEHGLSHFHIACFRNKEYLVENFLRNGVDVNSKYRNNERFHNVTWCERTGLHFVADIFYKQPESCLETIRVLLKYKADVNVKDRRGMNVLYSLRGEQTTFKSNTVSAMLLSGDYNEDCTSDVELFKLFHMCQNEDLEKLTSALRSQPNLIRASVSNDSRLWPGYTLLHFAATFHIYKVLFLLLDATRFDNANATNTKKQTPLHCLLEPRVHINGESHTIDVVLDVIRYFLQSKAELFREDFNGFTPIDYALGLASELKTNMFIRKFFEIIHPPRLSDHEELDRLFYACLEADFDYVEELVKDGRLKKLINMTVADLGPFRHALQGCTPLHFAVHGGEEKIVKILLENGADFCAQGANGLSPLHLAERTESYSIVEMILKFHSDDASNPVDQNGLSHLHIACNHFAHDVIRSFLKGKINANAVIINNNDTFNCNEVYTRGDTPLHVLAKSDSFRQGFCDSSCAVNIVKLLLDNGADFTMKNAHGTTPLHLFFAIGLGNRDVLDCIFSHSTKKLMNLVDNDGWSYLYIACYLGKPNIVRGILENGTETINEGDNMKNETPLHGAVNSGCLQIIQMLVDRGADINAMNFSESTPLHRALQIRADYERKNEIINCLVSKLDVEKTISVDENGLTFLHIATVQNDTKTMERLLKLGMDVNSAINLNSSLWPGFTPLHLAVGFEHTDAIKLLLNKGADFSFKTKNGIPSFGIMSDRVTTEAHFFASLSRSKSGWGKILPAILGSNRLSEIINVPFGGHLSIFHFACYKWDKERIQVTLKLGADVNCPVDFFSDEYPGYTGLHFAVDSGCIEKIKMLVDNGADLNAQDAFGWTPVHLACIQSNLQILKFLISKGAYINGRVIKHPRNDSKYELATPIHLCAGLREFDICKFLLKSGADISLTNATGKTTYSEIYFADSALMSLHSQILTCFSTSINDQFNRPLFSSDDRIMRIKLHSLKDECQGLLNDQRLVGKYTTLSDLITSTPRKMYQLIKQTKLQEILYSNEFDEKYPNCGFILKLQFQKGLEYKELLRNTMYMIGSFVKYYLPLPELCVKKVLENLDGNDLENLAEVNNMIILNRTWF